MSIPDSSANRPRISAEDWQALSSDARRDILHESWNFVSPLVDRYRTSTAADIRAAIRAATVEGQPDEAEALRLFLGLRDGVEKNAADETN